MKASKILSVLLIVAMCFSMMAVTAFATGPVVVVGVGSGNDGAASTTTDGSSAAVIVNDGENAGTESGGSAPSVNADDSSEGIVFYAATNTGAEDEDEAENETTALAENTVAVIGEAEYENLGTAIAAAKAGETVKLVKDVPKKEALSIRANITLDLGGKTLTFTPAQDQDAAINVSGTVTIKNGKIVVNTYDKTAETKGGFANAILSSGALTLDVDLSYAAPTAGGNMLAVDDDEGSIAVIGGEYSADPGSFVAEDYKAVPQSDGSYLVEEDKGNVDVVDPDDPDYVAQVGETKYETLAAAYEAVAENGTITLLTNVDENLPGTKNVTIDLGDHILGGSASVSEGKSVTIQNGTVTGDIAVSGTLTLRDYAVVGKINLADGSTLNVNAQTVITDDISANGAVTVNISAGTFGALTAATDSDITGNVTGGTFEAIDAEFVADGYEAVQNGNKYTVREKVTSATATVTDTNGNAYNSSLANSSVVHYFKGSTQVTNTDLIFLKDTTFVLDEELSELYADGTKLTSGTDYNYSASTGKLSIVTSAAFLDNLDAGLCQLSFAFENGAKVNVPLRVWPDVSFASAEYVIGSGKNFVISSSDLPDKVSFGSSSATDTHNDVDAANILTSTTGFEIKSSYMDKLTAGAQIIGLWYDGLPIMYQITVRAAVSIAPTDDNKDAKWYYGDGVLKFDVSAKVTGVSVDGSTIDSKNYSVNDDGILTLKAAFLKTLAYGEHSLTVSTDYGSASTKFTTAPSVVAKNGSNHTKGGTKDLAFTSSDPVTEVYVGSKKLDSANYTISSDGKTITLKAAFLNTLKADTTYTLTVKGDAGTASTTFKILSPGSAASNPKTGDESSIALWVVVLVLSGAAAVALMPRKKKQ